MGSSMVEQHFDAIVALVAGGMSIPKALASNPAFPKQQTFKWFAYHKGFPERGRRVAEAQAEGKAVRDQTYRVQHYTEAQYERSLSILHGTPEVRIADLNFEGGPGYTGLWARAHDDQQFAARFDEARSTRRRGGRAKTYAETHYADALVIIRRDGLIAYRAARTAGMPCHATLWKNSRRDADFAQDYRSSHKAIWDARRLARRAKQHQEKIDRDRRRELRVGDIFRQALNANDLYHRVSQAVPRRMEDDIREDVISDMIEAVSSGEIEVWEIEDCVGEFVSEHNRRFSRLQYASLDAPIPGNAAGSLQDLLTTSEWSYEGAS